MVEPGRIDRLERRTHLVQLGLNLERLPLQVAVPPVGTLVVVRGDEATVERLPLALPSPQARLELPLYPVQLQDLLRLRSTARLGRVPFAGHIPNTVPICHFGISSGANTRIPAAALIIYKNQTGDEPQTQETQANRGHHP